jgi:hypothetical protein
LKNTTKVLLLTLIAMMVFTVTHAQTPGATEPSLIETVSGNIVIWMQFMDAGGFWIWMPFWLG